MAEINELLLHATDILQGSARPEKSFRDELAELANWIPEDAEADNYGRGEYVKAFEAEVAEMFGKESAVFLPSGTLAQQIAMRIWCEKSGKFTVAMHPTAHPEFAEHAGYPFVHNIKRIQFGVPEFLRERLLNVDDFRGLDQLPGAALLELPQRELGGPLPAWDDLVATSEWTHKHDIPLHMDGARVWVCRPFYGKSYAEIAALFDSVYVSFYKDLGGLAGAMLLGGKYFIREARVWQKRLGGVPKTMGTYVFSAKRGMERTLPEIDGWAARAKEIAAIFAAVDGVTVSPNPPHVNRFLVFLRGEREALMEKYKALVEKTGVFLFYGLGDSGVPGVAKTEIIISSNAMTFDLDKLTPFLEELVA